MPRDSQCFLDKAQYFYALAGYCMDNCPTGPGSKKEACCEPVLTTWAPKRIFDPCTKHYYKLENALDPCNPVTRRLSKRIFDPCTKHYYQLGNIFEHRVIPSCPEPFPTCFDPADYEFNSDDSEVPGVK